MTLGHWVYSRFKCENISFFNQKLYQYFVLYQILMQNCCPKGSWDQLRTDYNPKGEDLIHEEVSIYCSGKGDKAIVIFSDIFGAKSGRHRNVADLFAAMGYQVFLPELLITPYEADFPSIIDNVKGQDFELMNEKFQKVLKLLQLKGIKHFLSLSFCWGVWFSFKMASIHQGFIAIMGIHPSLGVETMFGGKQIDLINQVKCPAYFCPASNDPPSVKKDGELVLALAKRFGIEKTGSNQFPDMMHGWSVRGDMSIQNVARDVHKVFELTQQYFSKL